RKCSAVEPVPRPRRMPGRTCLAACSAAMRLKSSLLTPCSPLPSAIEAAHHEIFDFGELLDAVARALATDARLLDAPKRCLGGGDEPRIDADHAVVERLGHAPHPAEIARIEIGGEPELRRIGEADHLLLVAEAEQRRHRAE